MSTKYLQEKRVYQRSLQGLVRFKKACIVVYATHVGRVVGNLREDITQVPCILENSVIGAFGESRLPEGVDNRARKRLFLSRAAVWSKRKKFAWSVKFAY